MVDAPQSFSIRSTAREVRDTARFFTRPPKWSEVLSEELPFGPVANDRFREALTHCQQYLEYGSGSSTLVAAAQGLPFVTVESDLRFLDAVRGRCALTPAPMDGSSGRHFLFADIGLTGPWGVPVNRVRTTSRVERWSLYPFAPWRQLGPDFRADLVLVDGRFRVACALTVLLRQGTGPWLLLLDDFAERPEYSGLLAVADLQEMWGRMAVFGPKDHFDPEQAQVMLSRFLSDWR